MSFRALRAPIDASIAVIGQAVARVGVAPDAFGHGLIGDYLARLLSGRDIVLHPLGNLMANDLGQIIDSHKDSFMCSAQHSGV